MRGLGLYGGALALVVLPDETSPAEERPAGYVRMGQALGVIVSQGVGAPDDRIMESVARLWLHRYPTDIVMVVEVMK